MAEAVICYLHVAVSKIMRHIAERMNIWDNSNNQFQHFTVGFLTLRQIHLLQRIDDLYADATTSGSAEAAADEVTWLLDSGASHHVTGNRSLLLTDGYLPVVGKGVVVHQHAKGGEVPLRVRGSGSVRTESIALDDVWYVPGLDANLVSTGQLARQGCAITLGPGGCRVTRAGALVGSARFTEASHFQLDFLKLADP